MIDNFSLARTPCDFCLQPLQDSPRTALTMLFLCRHVVHATCVAEPESLPSMSSSDYIVRTEDGISTSRGINESVALCVFFVVLPFSVSSGSNLTDYVVNRGHSESMLKLRIGRGCPVCHRNEEGKTVLQLQSNPPRGTIALK